jgi:integrase
MPAPLSTAPLTAAAVEKIRPAAKRRVIRDHGAKGLFLVIEPSGHKSWRMRFRGPTGPIGKLTIGTYDRSRELVGEPVIGQPLTLAAARQLTAWVHRQRALGRDVIADVRAAKRRARIETETLAANTLGAAVRSFVDEYARPNLRLWRRTARLLGLNYSLKDHDAAPTETRGGLAERWADKPVTDIDEHDIFEVVDEAKRFGIPGLTARKKGLSEVRARSFFIALSSLMSWLKRERRIRINPCSGITRPSGGNKRDRELTHDEIRYFWAASETIGVPSDAPRPFAPVLKLLLLTGQRPNEIAGMTHDELHDDGSWWLPGSRTKNKLPHIVPLAPLARELIAGMPLSGNLVFTTNGKTPVAGWSRLKRHLDATMLAFAKKERGPHAKIAPWQLRDLRRTAVTGMRKLGVPSDLVELIINHVSGHRAGVAGVYDVAELLPDRKEALAKWARFVALMVDKDLYIAHQKFLAHDNDEKVRENAFKEAITKGGGHWQRYLLSITTDDQANVVALPRGAA